MIRTVEPLLKLAYFLCTIRKIRGINNAAEFKWIGFFYCDIFRCELFRNCVDIGQLSLTIKGKRCKTVELKPKVKSLNLSRRFET